MSRRIIRTVNYHDNLSVIGEWNYYICFLKNKYRFMQICIDILCYKHYLDLNVKANTIEGEN